MIMLKLIKNQAYTRFSKTQFWKNHRGKRSATLIFLGLTHTEMNFIKVKNFYWSQLMSFESQNTGISTSHLAKVTITNPRNLKLVYFFQKSSFSQERPSFLQINHK